MDSHSRILPAKQKTMVMGILNVTPDSFSDGGLYVGVKQAVKRATQMANEGADIIDIGGESSRPGAEAVSVEEEMRRVVPVIAAVKKKLGNRVIISVDTYKSSVADAAIKTGAQIINSLGGSRFDSQIYPVVRKHDVPIIVYHIKGEPRTMQKGEIAYKDVIKEIAKFFQNEVATAKKFGVAKKNIWLDPGIGFGKTVEQNLEIIRRLKELQTFDLPIVIGVSRKSHLGVVLKESLNLEETPSPTERIEAALVETVVAVLNGACIVRTHDVLATKKCLAVVDFLKYAK